MGEKFRVMLGNPVILERYNLPPIYAMKGPIWWVLAQAENKKARRYYAVSFIMGQPYY